MKTYAIFWTDDTEDWPTQAFYGLWSEDTPEKAIKRSCIAERNGKATVVAVLEWKPMLFRRTHFERVAEDAE